MSWLAELFRSNHTARALVLVGLVCMLGMLLGGVKVRGIGLGTAAVLFAGIVMGSLVETIDEGTLEFLKESGLVLFVFCIGLQLGPGFFASFRRMGLGLNALAAAVVVLGALATIGLARLLGIDPAAALGLFSGATTNTPSLGAAQQALADLPGVSAERAALPALAYAVSYPVAICGIIGAILVLKKSFRVDPAKEVAALTARQRVEPIERRTLVIDNPSVDGVPISGVATLGTGVIVSRIKRQGQPETATVSGSTVLHRGDMILAVGTHANLDRCQRVVGFASEEDLAGAPGAVTHRRVVVTNKDVLGKAVNQLDLGRIFGVTVTRITRADHEMTAVPGLQLQFGDVLQVVGSEENIARAARLLGDSLKALNETQFVSLFAGIVLGVVLGLLPIDIPGMPQPVRLGLAGGPLIVAILVGRLGRIGPLVWHMPLNANLAFREFGIALFFASVGLAAGPRFFSTAFTFQGLRWMTAGLCVTVVPILAVGVFAIALKKMSFVATSGLIAGSMTDPPALTFANNICGSDAPTVAYATVYPLTTLMRILSAQVLAVVLCR